MLQLFANDADESLLLALFIDTDVVEALPLVEIPAGTGEVFSYAHQLMRWQE